MPPAENILQKARFFISQNLGNRYNDMEDVVRANFLLDHALQVFSQKNDDCQLLMFTGAYNVMQKGKIYALSRQYNVL